MASKKRSTSSSFDLDYLVIRDKVHREVLRHLTMLNVERALDAWIYWKKTGVMTMAITDRVIITFNNLAKLNGIDLSKRGKETITSAEKAEIIADVQKRLDAWIKPDTNRPFQGAMPTPLDDKAVKHLTAVMHRLFKKFAGPTHALKLDMVAGMYLVQSEDDKEPLIKKDETLTNTKVRDSIKQLIHQVPGVFALGSGGAADVVRLFDEKGKPTGAKAPPPKAAKGTAGINDSTKIKKYMASVAALGFSSKTQFLLAKAHYKQPEDGYITIGQAKEWLKTHTSN